MDFSNRTPCKSCPYRKDVKLKFWHRSEFENLLAHDEDPLNGAMFGCHEDGKKEMADRRPCIGWVLDQRRRNVPSIQLRLAIIRNPECAELLADANDGGAELYSTMKSMCRANGVRKAKRR